MKIRFRLFFRRWNSIIAACVTSHTLQGVDPVKDPLVPTVVNEEEEVDDDDDSDALHAVKQRRKRGAQSCLHSIHPGVRYK